VVIAACRYLNAAASPIEVPLGLGSRHIAAAHISAATRAIGIVVSESAVVRLFCHGALIGEIIPELWLMKRYDFQNGEAMTKETVGDLAVITPRRRRGAT
jgi:diadenylate cyclase